MGVWCTTDFRKESILIDNVSEVETHAMAYSMRAQTDAAMIFWDFAAAFPSVAHMLIWITLFMLKVPTFIIRTIQQLYKDNVHFIRFAGITKEAFVVRAGVKQGCPLSGLLFTSATVFCVPCAK